MGQVNKDDPQARVKIRHARELAKKHNLQGVIIIAIRDDGAIDTATYGSDPLKCNVLGAWMKGMAEKFLTKVPFVTFFGWGNQGKPVALSREELAGLNEKQRAWVKANTHPNAVQPGAENA